MARRFNDFFCGIVHITPPLVPKILHCILVFTSPLPCTYYFLKVTMETSALITDGHLKWYFKWTSVIWDIRSDNNLSLDRHFKWSSVICDICSDNSLSLKWHLKWEYLVFCELQEMGSFGIPTSFYKMLTRGLMTTGVMTSFVGNTWSLLMRTFSYWWRVWN